MSTELDDDFVDERLRVLAYMQQGLRTGRGEHTPWEEVVALRPVGQEDTDNCFTAALAVSNLLLRQLAHSYEIDPQALLDRLRDGVASGTIPWTVR